MQNHFAMPLNYNQVIEESLRELRERVRQREEADKRIGQLIKALHDLAPMLPVSERSGLFSSVKIARRKGLGLTEIILDILRDSDVPLSVSDIRDRMQESGFDLSKYSRASATIHNTMRRLVQSKRAMPMFSKDRVVLYKLAGK